MRWFLIILSFAFLFGCSQDGLNNEDFHIERVINQITKKVAIQIKHTTNLWPCGFGGQTIDGIQMLYLGFDCYKKIGIEEARLLLIKAVDEFVGAVNAEKRLHPYLKEGYPFKPNNVQIAIFLEYPESSNPGKMWVAKANEGVLEYKINDSEDVYKSITILKESYEEAVQKIKETTEDRASPKTSI